MARNSVKVKMKKSDALNATLSLSAVRLLVAVIEQAKGNAARSSLYNMASICKAFVFHILVNTYGDVPYTLSGRAFPEGVNLPKYDDRKAIYERHASFRINPKHSLYMAFANRRTKQERAGGYSGLSSRINCF